MTTTPQTEAQRLADGLLAETSKFGTPSIQRGLLNGAIQELRRLDAVEAEAGHLRTERDTANQLCKEAMQSLKAVTAERDQLRAQVERLQGGEPFGYFKAEPFGWTDCAKTDEGAIPLYAAQPAAPAMVPLSLPAPFGYVGPSMLTRPQRHTSQTFLGHFDRPSDRDEPVFTLSQIRWACTMSGIGQPVGGEEV